MRARPEICKGTPPAPALDTSTAIVQAAYPTIPANEQHGGRIFRTRITLDTPILGLTYEFDTN